MHDAVGLEKLGIPTAVIVTSEFVHEARLQQRALGMPDLPFVVIDHPLSTISLAAIRERAQQAGPQVLTCLTAQKKSPDDKGDWGGDDVAGA